jgi:hypothetical protein
MLKRFGVQRIRTCRVRLVERASRVCPTGCFSHTPGFVDGPVAAVRVSLQCAAERLEVLLRMDALAIWRVGKSYRRRRHIGGGTIIAHAHPQATGLRLAVARREHRYRRVIGVEFRCRHHVTTQRLDERLQERRGVTDPLRE